jgi:hypothetical protein
LLYTVSGENLHVVDVSNPAAPMLKGSVHFAADLTAGIGLNLNSIAAKDSNLYIGGTQIDLRVVHYDAVANTFTYVGDSGWSGSTGGSPVIAGNYLFFHSSRGGLARASLPVSGFIDSTPVFPQYGSIVATQGQFGYALRYINASYALDIVNLADPINLPVVSSYALPTTPSYTFPAAMAATDQQAVVITAYANTRILDVSDITHPAEVGTYVLDGTGTRVQVDGGYAYLAQPYAGLQILDMADITQPVKRLTIASTGYIQDVAVQGDYVFMLEGQTHTVRIFNKTNPDAPLAVAEFVLTPPASAPDSGSYSVAVSGNLLMAGIGSDIQLLDISTPSQPKALGRYSASSWVRRIQIVNTTAIVADGNEMLMLDVSKPATPTVKGRFAVPIIFDARMQGNYVYAIGGSSYGLQVLNVTNPAKITQVGFASVSGTLQALAVDGNAAYVASQYSGVQVVDISVPTQPLVVGTYYDRSVNGLATMGPYFLTAGSSIAMKVVENLAYTGGGVPPPPSVNQPPVANAGPDQSVASKAKVNLNGSNSSDPDGAIVSYQWKQTSGAGVSLKNADAAVASFTAPTVRRGTTTLTFDMTVTDDQGASATDSVVVVVHK